MRSFERALNFLQLSVRALWVPVTFGVRTIMEDKDGRIAFIRHSYASGWTFPGGGVDRKEAPERAAVREAEEEVGLTKCGPAEYFGLYTQSVGWVTNVVAVYRLRECELTFRKSLEVREMVWALPDAPPPGTTDATLRRLAELTGKAAKSSRW